MKRVLIALAALALLAGSAMSEEAQVIPYGFVQTWYSSASNGLDGDDAISESGFGLKRARLAAMLKKDNFKGNIMIEGAGSFKVMDAFIDWTINDMFSLTMGRFRGAGSQAGGLTSPVVKDLPEYGLVGKNWAAGTVGGDSRTVGTELTITPTKIIELKALLHNGSGGTSFFHSTASGAYTGTTDTGMMPKMDFGAKAKLWPGTEAGFTMGLGNENRRNWRDDDGSGTPYFDDDDDPLTDEVMNWDEFYGDSNWSTHLHLNLGTLFAKFEMASVLYKYDWDNDDDDITARGMAFTGGYIVLPQTQLVVRYDTWDPNTASDAENNGQKNLTFGVNYSFNESQFGLDYRNRVQLALTKRMDEKPDGADDRADDMLIQFMWTYLIK
jgi:hypothetical protein